MLANHSKSLFFKWVTHLFLVACVQSALIAQVEHPSHPTHHDLSYEHSSNWFTSAMWDSKYISEGRDNLEDGGLGSVALEWNQHFENGGEMILAGWYAEGTSVDYSELNLAAAYGWSLENLDIAIGYTWLDFAEDNESDNEFVLVLGTTAFNDLDFGAAFVYSDEAGGTFIELVVSRSFEDSSVSWTPYLLIGINEGYVADEHDGLNNLQMGLEISTPLNDSVELGGYIAYTIGLFC